MTFTFLLSSNLGSANNRCLDKWGGYSDVYSEPCQTSTFDLFTKIVYNWKALRICAKSYISDIWQGSNYLSEYACVLYRSFFVKTFLRTNHTLHR